MANFYVFLFFTTHLFKTMLEILKNGILSFALNAIGAVAKPKEPNFPKLHITINTEFK